MGGTLLLSPGGPSYDCHITGAWTLPFRCIAVIDDSILPRASGNRERRSACRQNSLIVSSTYFTSPISRFAPFQRRIGTYFALINRQLATDRHGAEQVVSTPLITDVSCLAPTAIPAGAGALVPSGSRAEQLASRHSVGFAPNDTCANRLEAAAGATSELQFAC